MKFGFEAKQDKRFIPLLFAGDINVYSMARAFYEIYGIKPYVYGKYPAWPCKGSKIMNYTPNANADEQGVFFDIVNDFASHHSEDSVLLIGCGDSYVQLISGNMDKLPENVIAPYIPIDLMNDLINKEKFYEMCKDADIDHPETFVHRKEMGQDFKLPFEAPYIVKPANGIMYWKHPFEGQKKVFKENTKEDLFETLNAIYQSGYDDSVIIQDFVPGDDTYMRVLTSYSDKHGKVKLMSLGHVLLEEHTPHGIGNHAVIITEQNRELEERFRLLLEGMDYVGFSNFDIKYDKRDGKYKVFEINTRQGRSNYYVTAAGANLAQYVVEDYINDHPIDFKSVDKESLWMVVPKGVAFRYIKPLEYKEKMKELIRSGQAVNPLYYENDSGFLRRLSLFKSQLSHYYKFAKYMR
jgi:D-aspartate ligase